MIRQPNGDGPSCPNAESLRAYLADELDVERDRELGDHIASCDECNRMIELEFGANDSVPKSISLAKIADRLIEAKPAEGLPFGKYLLVDCIGEGGMGVVYRAYMTSMDRYCAVKLLSAERLSSHDARTRFQREIVALGKLENPHIVTAYDAGEHDGQAYLAMKYVDGPNAEQLMQHVGKLPIADACEIIRQAAMGLLFVHSNDLVHRDVKPSNLMVDRTGNVFVTDLGIAKPTNAPGRDMTSIVGTPYFMSPEQMEGKGIDHRADIYALGKSFSRLLSLKFGIDGRPDVNSRDLPDELRQLIEKMCARDVGSRPENLEEVVYCLEAYVGESQLGDLVKTVKIESTYSPVERQPSCAKQKGWGGFDSDPPQSISKPESHRRLWTILSIVFTAFVVICIPIGLSVLRHDGHSLPNYDVVGRYALLERSATPLVTVPDTFYSTKTDEQELRVDSAEMCAIQLGTTNAEQYKLSMDIEQHELGGVAIYLGGQKIDYQGKPAMVLQFLKLEKDPLPRKTRYFIKRGVVIVNRDTSDVITTDWMMSQLVELNAEKPFEVVIDVFRGSLKNVRVAGKDLMDLIATDLDIRANAFAPGTNDLTRGSFGVSIVENTATVTNAVLKVERKAQATSVSLESR